MGIQQAMFSIDSGETITLQNEFIGAFAIGETAYAGYQLGNDGNIRSRSGNFSSAYSSLGSWIDPKNNMSTYECRATLTSGTFNSGTAGSWLALSSTRTWEIQVNPVGFKETVFTIEIRKIGGSTILDSASVTLQVTTEF